MRSAEEGTHVGRKIGITVEHRTQAVEVGAAVGKMTGNECGAGMLFDSAFERVNDFIMLKHTGVFGDLPFQGVHQAIVGFVDWLVHPFILTDVDVDRHAENGAFFEQRIHARIIDVHAESVGGRAPCR